MTAISARLEDYLETIWLLSQGGAGAHVADIARRLGVSRPTVTEALGSLVEKGLVLHERYAAATLTAEGATRARAVRRKHEALRRFLIDVLSLDPAAADEQACLLEHGASRELTDRLAEFTEFIETCPRAGSKWVRGVGYRCLEADRTKECRLCIESCLKNLEEGTDMRHPGGRLTDAARLRPGERGTIEKIAAQSVLRKRLTEMGVARGATIEAVRVAPLGDPIDFKIKGYHLTLRKNEASAIEVRIATGGTTA